MRSAGVSVDVRACQDVCMSKDPYVARAEDGVAWNTGASAGIGAAVAQRLADAGFTVAVTARREEELAALAEGIPGPGRIVPFPGDVTDGAATTRKVGGRVRCV